jgi:hypothetical protein
VRWRCAGILPKLDDMNFSSWESNDQQFLDQIVRQFATNPYFGSLVIAL